MATKYELANRLVRDHIYHRANLLMSGVAKIMHEVCDFKDAFGDDPDDVQNLLEGTNWEGAGRAYIDEKSTGVNELEEIADRDGWWYDMTVEVCGIDMQEMTGPDGALPDDFDLDVWLDDHPEQDKALREKVADSVGDWESLCRDLDIDASDYRVEIYEHWIVDDWLASKLRAAGEVVGEFADFTIWGRATTGQAIALDYVIQKIAAETWPDELDAESDLADAF